ncbi:MAG: phosphoribosylaminoimidazolecarboxamide formyltransferase [Oscillospiraceae bacterium]|nr:phosphoribosylaminoimidazolecarboxamide formyltransferase [Oscillospiraceae bacterium]
MNELQLKYGCNPNQKPSRIYMEDCGTPLPLEVLSGTPGYINFMDALNGYQLVKELKVATGLPAATSFKHVSPAGAAVCTSIASAYGKARNADPLSSYGDFIALSDKCDVETANIIKSVVSDGVIAPDYDTEALEILRQKRKGGYNVIKINSEYIPAPIERRHIYGITFEQGRNELLIDKSMFSNIVTENKDIPDSAKTDLIVALITLKYTQSNSVVYAYDGQAIGVGAGQQSRIACTQLAGNKADDFFARTKLPQKGVSVASDAFFPFADNIERAKESGVAYIAQPGGSIRDDEVIEACNKYKIAMAFTGIRLFHH